MPDISLCPNCDQPVQPGWKACPMCARTLIETPSSAIREAAYRKPGSSRRKKRHWAEPIPAEIVDIEKDVKTDTTVIGAILLTLGILGLVGIILYVVNLDFSKTPPSPGGILAIGSAVLVLIVVGTVLGTRRAGAGMSTAVGVFSGVATAGLIAAVMMLLIVASILNFFCTCGGMGGPIR